MKTKKKSIRHKSSRKKKQKDFFFVFFVLNKKTFKKALFPKLFDQQLFEKSNKDDYAENQTLFIYDCDDVIKTLTCISMCVFCYGLS